MSKYFVYFKYMYEIGNFTPQKLYTHEESTIIELDYRVDSEENLYKLAEEIGLWKNVSAKAISIMNLQEIK